MRVQSACRVILLPPAPGDPPESGLIVIENHRFFVYTRKDNITTINYSFLLFSHLAIVYPQGRTSTLLEGLISLTLPHIHLLLTLAIIPVPINRLSIFISSCSSDVQTIFSTAEKREDREEDILFFIKELGWNEHRKCEPSA